MKHARYCGEWVPRHFVFEKYRYRKYRSRYKITAKLKEDPTAY